MKKSKIFISSAVALTMLAVVVAGAAPYKEIKAGIKPNAQYLTVWGTKQLTDKNGNPSDILIYNNKPYISVESAEQILGKSITWDEKTNTLKINRSITTPASGVTQEKANQIALNDAGFTSSEVVNLKSKHSKNDNRNIYEVEFYVGNYKYEYDIDDVSGEIISCERKLSSGGLNNQNNSVSNEIGNQKALSIALNDAKVSSENAKHILIKNDTEDGVKTYDIEFWSGNTKYEYEINAYNGNIISREQETKAVSTSSNTYISEKEAKNIALKYANLSENSVSKMKVKLDVSNGKAFYEIEWYVGLKECKVNASTGEVVEYDVD